MQTRGWSVNAGEAIEATRLRSPVLRKSTMSDTYNHDCIIFGTKMLVRIDHMPANEDLKKQKEGKTQRKSST